MPTPKSILMPVCLATVAFPVSLGIHSAPNRFHLVPPAASLLKETLTFPGRASWMSTPTVTVRGGRLLAGLIRGINAGMPPKFWECDMAPTYTLRFETAGKPPVTLVAGCGAAMRRSAGLKSTHKRVATLSPSVERHLAAILRRATKSHEICHQRWHGYELKLCRPLIRVSPQRAQSSLIAR